MIHEYTVSSRNKISVKRIVCKIQRLLFSNERILKKAEMLRIEHNGRKIGAVQFLDFFATEILT